jgi:hypothetical protein
MRTGLEIHMCYFPPGTPKWNKVEHRLFCYISKKWQGKPLIDVERNTSDRFNHHINRATRSSVNVTAPFTKPPNQFQMRNTTQFL